MARRYTTRRKRRMRPQILMNSIVRRPLLIAALLGMIMAAQADDELTPRQMQAMLYAGTFENISRVALAVDDQDIEDTKVLDILAEYIFKGYDLGHPEASIAVARACIALRSADNVRYYPVLKLAAEKGAVPQVRKHCGKAFSRIEDDIDDVTNPRALYREGQFVFARTTEPEYLLYGKSTLDNKDKTIENQLKGLLSGDEREVLSALQSIIANRGTFQVVNDVVAELIIGFFNHDEYIQADSLAWACRAIAASRSARYEEITSTAYRQGARVNRSVKKHCGTAYEYTRGIATSDHYVPGSVDMAALRKQYGVQTAQSSGSENPVKEKIRLLTELYNEGLIDQAAFEAKRDELLGQL